MNTAYSIQPRARALLLAALAAAPVTLGFAQTFRDAAQTSTGTYDWFDQNNWRTGATLPPQTVPNGTSSGANFNTSLAEIGALQAVTYNLTANATLAAIVMNGSGANAGRTFTLSGTGGSLTMDRSGTGNRASITANGSTSEEAFTISANVVLADTEGTDINTNASARINGNISGSSAWTKGGANQQTLFLGGTNTYSGNITIINGTVIATSTGAFSSSSAGISFEGQTNAVGLGTRVSGTTTVGSAITLGNSTTAGHTITLSHGGANSMLDLTSSTINMGAGNQTINISRTDGANSASFGFTNVSGNGSVRFSGTGFTFSRNLAVNANTSLILNPGSGTQTWTGNITGAGVGIEKTGAGTAVINNATGNNNTFSGALTVTEGTLQLGQTGSANRGLSGVASVNVASGATLEYGRDGWSSGAAIINNGTIRGINNGTFQAFGALTMNGGTLTTRNGLTAAFQGGALNGNVVVGGSAASLINTTGTTNNALHLANNTASANRSFTVNDVTGNSSADLTVSVALIDSSNNAGASSLTKLGAGTMVLSAANGYTGSTTVSAGTLALGANNVFADTSTMVLNGGTLSVGSFTDTAGSLDLSSLGGGLSLGSGGTFAFADSSALDWNGGSLSVTGVFISGSSLRFGTNSSGLTLAQLASISIAGNSQPISLDSFGYLTAVPEPSSFAAFAGLGAVAFVGLRRRRRA